jgi:hypothetical protein
MWISRPKRYLQICICSQCSSKQHSEESRTLGIMC